MSKVKFAKTVLSLLVATVIMFSSAVSALATCEAEFSLSDAQASLNRLFEVTLCAKGDINLSSFVAELAFDSQVLKFDSASVEENDAQYSVNTSQKGRLTAVYLCEDGVSLEENKSLMTFTFKALNVGNTQIELSVRDAITSDLTDVAVSECVYSKVTVTGANASSTTKDKNPHPNDAEKEDVTSTEKSEVSFIKGRTDIAGFSISNQTLVSLSLSFVCTLWWSIK